MLTYFVDHWWTMLAAAALLALFGAALIVRAAGRGPYPGLCERLIWWVSCRYVRVVHNLVVVGAEHLPERAKLADPDRRPLIVIANHTAGVDPILVATQTPFVIRWMMADDMRVPWLGWFWKWQRIIFVRREQRDGLRVRNALAELAAGGVVGIFPEGGLERPPQEIMPFLPGVGLLIRKSKARVLPVWIDGTPQVDPAWGSLWRRSRSRVEFGEVIDYEGSGLSAADIAADLRSRYITWTGWPANDTPPDPASTERASVKKPRRARTRREPSTEVEGDASCPDAAA